jgi:hypothetical protein
VSESSHDLGKKLEALPLLVRDQDAQVLDLFRRHRHPNLALSRPKRGAGERSR